MVGRLDAGDDLVEAITEVCRDRGVGAGQVRALGQFDAVELVTFDEDSKGFETVLDGKGQFDLLSLSGTVSRLGGEVALRLVATFGVMGPAGQQIVGGVLRRARAMDAEFVVEAFGDLQMERRLDGRSGRLVLDKIERIPGSGSPAAPKKPKPSAEAAPAADSTPAAASSEHESEAQPSLSWDQAIAETQKVETHRKERRTGGPKKGRGGGGSKTTSDPYADLNLDEPLMSAGDLLDHPKLGRCRVLNVEDDQYVRIRLPRGKIRKLALEVLDIEYQGQESGKMLFKARVRR